MILRHNRNRPKRMTSFVFCGVLSSYSTEEMCSNILPKLKMGIFSTRVTNSMSFTRVPLLSTLVNRQLLTLVEDIASIWTHVRAY